MISTRDLSRMPDVPTLRRLTQSMAMLDAILCPPFDLRWYRFDHRWAAGEEMGSMDSGSGDHFFALFNATGCWLKGFDHESPMSPYAHHPKRVAPGMFDGVPVEFAACLREPVFMVDDTTFCIWRRHDDGEWQRGPVHLASDHHDVDGSSWILSAFEGGAAAHQVWAQDYHGQEVPLAAVEAIFAHRPLDERLVQSLNPSLTLADLRGEIEEIGYRT